ncbi:MAG: LysR family transcriptional regulator [Maricaulaceae bacterium]
MISLTKLRHLIAVDRAGSFTAGAKALSITQSSLTKSVAEIERQIGYPVFLRKARGVVATDKGREFVDRAVRLVTDMDLLISDTDAELETRQSIFRIGICPPSLEGLLNRTLSEFIRANPKAVVHLKAVTNERGPLMLRRGDLDVLIGPTDALAAQADIKRKVLKPLKAKLFCRKGHPLLKRKTVRMKDIADYQIIVPDPGGIYGEFLREIYEAAGKVPERHMHVIESFPAIADIVASTDILATVSESYANTKAFSERFEILTSKVFDTLPLSFGCIPSDLNNKNIEAFLKTLLKHPIT